jgi:hypothetical protein
MRLCAKQAQFQARIRVNFSEILLVEDSGSLMATFSARTAWLPLPRRTPAGSRASGRRA